MTAKRRHRMLPTTIGDAAGEVGAKLQERCPDFTEAEFMQPNCSIRPARAILRASSALALVLLLASFSDAQESEPPPPEELTLVQEAAPAEGPFRYWTTNWSFEDFDVATLTQRLAAIGLELPVELSGTATVNFDVSIPLNALRNPRAYRFRGALSSGRLGVDQVTIEDLVVNLNYTTGRLTLSDLRGRLREGTFDGRGWAELVPREGFNASLELEQFDLAPIAELLAQFGLGNIQRPVQGRLNAELEASGRVDEVTDPMAWQAEGVGQISAFAVGDSSPFSIVLESFAWKDRSLSVPRLSVTSAAHPSFSMWLAGDVQLEPPLAFDLQWQADDLPSEDAARLWTDTPQQIVAGKLDMKGEAQGDLEGSDRDEELADPWSVDLDVASPRLRLFGVELGLVQHRINVTPRAFRLDPLVPLDDVTEARLQSLQADYQFDERHMELSALEAELFGGTIGGEASFALEPVGQHSLALRWQDLRPAVRLPIAGLASPPTISGNASGQIDWSVPASDVDRPASHRGTASLEVTELQLGEEVLGDLQLAASIDDSGFQLEGDGQLFGGRVQVRSATSLEASSGWDDLLRSLVRSDLELRSISLRRAIGNLRRVNGERPQVEAPPVVGRLDGSLRGELDDDGVVVTRSGFSVRGLAIDGEPITTQFDVAMASRGAEIEIRSARGNYAGGVMDIRGRWSLDGGTRRLELNMSGADSSRVLLPVLGPGVAELDGRMSARAILTSTGRGRREAMRMTGAVRLKEGVAWGVPVGDAHGPARFTFERNPTAWQLSFPRIRSALGGGMVTGKLSLASASGSRRGFRMDSNWQMNHVDFEELTATYVGSNTLGRGNLTGELRLGGRNIRGVQDLRGEFRTRLGGTDATAVPGLASAGSLLGPTALIGNRFTAGDFSGSISGGAVQVRELSLRGDRLRVFAEGRVGLANGRMDMQAVIATGNFEAQNLALAFLLQRTVVPLSTITTINRIASDRTLVLSVGGTFRDPQLRVLAAPTLQANTRRILVRETLGLILPEAALLSDE